MCWKYGKCLWHAFANSFFGVPKHSITPLCCIANILHITHLVGHHQHPPDHRSRVLGLVYIKWHVRMDVQGCLCCVYFGVVRFDLLFSVVYVSCVDQVEPVSR